MLKTNSRLPSFCFWQPSRHVIHWCRCGVLLLNTTGEQRSGQLCTCVSQDSCVSEGEYARHICPFVPEDLASFPAAAVVTCEILHPDCLLYPYVYVYKTVSCKNVDWTFSYPNGVVQVCDHHFSDQDPFEVLICSKWLWRGHNINRLVIGPLYFTSM